MSLRITVCEKAPRNKLLSIPRGVKCPACGRVWSKHKTIELPIGRPP